MSVRFEDGDTMSDATAQEPMKALPAGSPNGKGVPGLVRSIVADLAHLVNKQIELAKLELTDMVGARARAAGVFAAAGVLGLFVIGFLGLAGAAALDLVLPTWASLLIVAGVFAVLGVMALLVGKRSLRSPAKPELTQQQLKEDVTWAREQLKR